jgi:hypothetical protein
MERMLPGYPSSSLVRHPHSAPNRLNTGSEILSCTGAVSAAAELKFGERGHSIILDPPHSLMELCVGWQSSFAPSIE